VPHAMATPTLPPRAASPEVMYWALRQMQRRSACACDHADATGQGGDPARLGALGAELAPEASAPYGLTRGADRQGQRPRRTG
jgi:hypothetical protein